MSTKKQKARIHILKSEYQLSDVQYQDFLYENFEVTSSMDLTEEQCDQAIHLLQYKYDRGYKQGYDRAVSLYANLEDVFVNTIQQKLNRDVTPLELKMFRLSDKQQQKELIENI